MAEYIYYLLSQKVLGLATDAGSFVVYGEFLLSINSETKGVAIFFLFWQSKLDRLYLSMPPFFYINNQNYYKG